MEVLVVDWDEARGLLKSIDRFPEFCERFLYIQPEGGASLIPFKLNAIQNWLHKRYVAPAYRQGRPVRLVVTKGRQTGVSTYSDGLGYWSTVGHPHWNSLVIGEDSEQTRTLFRMVKRFNNYSPWGMDPPDLSIFPEFPQNQDSLDALEFSRPSKHHKGRLYKGRDDVVFLDSRIEVKSAEKKDALGRAGFYHTVHASEAARWPQLADSLGALLSCCHPKKHTVVIIECTANGFNEFHGFWNNLKIGEMEVPSIWQKVFIPWYWKPEYELPLKIDRRFDDEYEEGLFRRIWEDSDLRGMDRRISKDRVWAKLFWRRRQIRDVFFGNIDKFKQEFPATDAEAFVFSGTSVYSASSLHRLEAGISEPIWRGNVSLVTKKKEKEETLEERPTTEVLCEEHDRGNLKVKEWADDKHLYALFADVAEGKAVEGVLEEKSKWDFSCAQIVKVTSHPPMKQVAVWHGNCDPDYFGDVLVALARLYNDGFLAWEINGPGRGLGWHVIRKHRYKNIHLREDYDTLSHRMTMKPGWITTRKTKPYMVAVSQRFVRLGELEIFDSSTLSEMKAFARVGENRYEAAQGHDDRVIALCGLCAVIEERIELMKNQVKRQDTKKKENHVRHPDIDYYEPESEEGDWNPMLGYEW